MRFACDNIVEMRLEGTPRNASTPKLELIKEQISSPRDGSRASDRRRFFMHLRPRRRRASRLLSQSAFFFLDRSSFLRANFATR